MTEEQIAERLVTDFGYRRPAAAIVAAEFTKCTQEIQQAITGWWSSGEFPEISVEEFSLHQLIKDHGMKPPAALLTLDWLLVDPVNAKASLARGHDRLITKAVSPKG